MIKKLSTFMLISSILLVSACSSNAEELPPIKFDNSASISNTDSVIQSQISKEENELEEDNANSQSNIDSTGQEQSNNSSDNETDNRFESTVDSSEDSPTHPENTYELDSSSQNEEVEDSSGVDFDLTIMSSTMVYSQVFDLMINPETYIGKTFKLEGSYFPQYYEAGDITYRFIVINDATGCCPQGIEFNCTTDVDYPEKDEMIEIIGTFESYYDGDNLYYRMSTDDVTF